MSIRQRRAAALPARYRLHWAAPLHCAIALLACLLTWWSVTCIAVDSHWDALRAEPLWRLTLRSLGGQLSNSANAVFFAPFFAVSAFWWSRAARLLYLAAALLLLGLVLADDGARAHPGVAVWWWNLALGAIAAIHVIVHGAARLWLRRRRRARTQSDPTDSV